MQQHINGLNISFFGPSSRYQKLKIYRITRGIYSSKGSIFLLWLDPTITWNYEAGEDDRDVDNEVEESLDLS